MSHLVTIQTKVKDERAVRRACELLKLKAPRRGKFTVYTRELEGLGVFLPGWSYAMVINTTTGETQLDNYNGHWGAQVELDKFMQRYGIEAAKQLAEDEGKAYSEEYVNEQGHLCIDVDAVAAGANIQIGLDAEAGGDTATGVL